MPKRSLNGPDSSPAFVVAPIRVNFGKGTRRVFTVCAFPVVMSRKKSSIAGYRISSVTLFSRWISSINKISPFFNDISMPMISLGRSRAGAEVILMFASSSFAITEASVVLPSPGGP